MIPRDVGHSLRYAILERLGRTAGRIQETKSLPVDLLESEDAYLAVFDAPGATQTDVQVRYLEGGVKVKVDRFRDFHEGFEMLIPGRGLSLSGEVDLPDGAEVDLDGASAELRDIGTLEVRVPKSTEEPEEEPAITEVQPGEEADDR